MEPSDSFHMWIEWSGEDGVYLGKCPDPITGIHGNDPVKLYAELLELVEEVISQFKETGHPPSPMTVRPMWEVS